MRIRRQQSALEVEENQTQRLEAFSDGVFAIAITLMVLEIRMPELSGRGGQAVSLASALLHQWPSYAAYAFSFLMVGIYWANHYYIFRIYKRSNHWFLMLNVFFLMCISFLPFPTEMLSKYFLEPGNYPDSVRFYEIGLILPATSWYMAWFYASRNGLIDEKLDKRFVRHLDRLFLFSIFIYCAALALSFWNPTAGLLVAVGLTMNYIRPPKEPRYEA